MPSFQCFKARDVCMPLHMYVTRYMCGSPTGSMPIARPVFARSQVYHNPSLGVSSVQVSNTQEVDVPRQHTLSFEKLPYYNHTWTFSGG